MFIPISVHQHADSNWPIKEYSYCIFLNCFLWNGLIMNPTNLSSYGLDHSSELLPSAQLSLSTSSSFLYQKKYAVQYLVVIRDSPPFLKPHMSRFSRVCLFFPRKDQATLYRKVIVIPESRMLPVSRRVKVCLELSFHIILALYCIHRFHVYVNVYCIHWFHVMLALYCIHCSHVYIVYVNVSELFYLAYLNTYQSFQST
jgi:hypothetical protein